MTLATTLGIDRLRANALLGLGWALMPADSVVACQRLDQAAQAFQDTDDSWVWR